MVGIIIYTLLISAIHHYSFQDEGTMEGQNTSKCGNGSQDDTEEAPTATGGKHQGIRVQAQTFCPWKQTSFQKTLLLITAHHVTPQQRWWKEKEASASTEAREITTDIHRHWIWSTKSKQVRLIKILIKKCTSLIPSLQYPHKIRVVVYEHWFILELQDSEDDIMSSKRRTLAG